jgi:hypothetical protein
MKTTAKKTKVEAIDLPSDVKIGKPEKKPKTELVSYSMRMVIPTGNYANIQPEIVVKSTSIEEAHNFIAPHMNKLWKEYYMISERRVETKTEVKAPQEVVATPVSSVAFIKASQAIQSCLSMEALNLIQKQIENSVKLTPEDKPALLKLSVLRAEELTKKNV